MTLKHCTIIVGLAVIQVFLTAPVSATPIPIAITGTVIDLNKVNQTLTLHAECQKYPCQYNLTGSFSGRVPNTLVFSRVKEGEVVEAVFKDWTFRVTDPSTGYVVPSADIRDLRQWYTIQRLAPQPGPDTLAATELFGDPAVHRVPFQGGFTIQYRLYGPSPGKYDFRSFPPQTIANISISRETGLSWSKVLATGETARISDPRNNTTFTMHFIGGYDAGYLVGKACPCASYHIRILSENESVTETIKESRVASSPTKTPLDPLTVVAVLGFLVGFTGLIKKRG